MVYANSAADVHVYVFVFSIYTANVIQIGRKLSLLDVNYCAKGRKRNKNQNATHATSNANFL